MLKFQLPPLKGTELFPDTIYPPPVFRLHVDPPERTDEGEAVIYEHADEIVGWVMAQRADYITSVIVLWANRYTLNVGDIEIVIEYRMLYKQEYVDVYVTLPPIEDRSPLCMLVLYEGDQVAAIPMDQLDTSFDPIYSTTLQQSSFDQFCMVTQLRIDDTYTVAMWPLKIADNIITAKDHHWLTFTSDVSDTTLVDFTSCDLNKIFVPFVSYKAAGPATDIFTPKAIFQFQEEAFTKKSGPLTYTLPWSITSTGRYLYGLYSLYTVGPNSPLSTMAWYGYPYDYDTGDYYDMPPDRYDEWLATHFSYHLCAYFVTEWKSMSGYGFYDAVALGNPYDTSDATATGQIPLLEDVIGSGLADHFFTASCRRKSVGLHYTGYTSPTTNVGDTPDPPSGNGLNVLSASTYFFNAGYNYISGFPLAPLIVYEWNYTVAKSLEQYAGFASTNALVGSQGDVYKTSQTYYIYQYDFYDPALTGTLFVTEYGIYSSTQTGDAINVYTLLDTLDLETPHFDAVTTTYGGWIEIGGYPLVYKSKPYYSVVSQPGIYDPKTYQHVTPYKTFTSSDPFLPWMHVSNGDYILQGFGFGDPYSAPTRRYLYLNGTDVSVALPKALDTDIMNINAILMDIPLARIQEFV